MVLKYHISPSSLTENFIVRIWEAASDGAGAHVYEQTINAPHSAPVTITVNGLDKVVHIVRMYGAVSANLLHEYNVEPLVETVEVFSPIFFKIGDGGTNTPAAGSDICTTPELIGLTDQEFIIHRNNYGNIHPTEHFTFNSGSGEWQLIPPDVFNDAEEFTIQRLPKAVSVVVNDSVVGKWYAGFVDVSVNTSYANSHLRKLIRFSGSPEYTFNVTDTVPIGYIFCFQHFGSAGTPKVNFLNGTLLWAGSPKTSLDIPQYHEGAFVWDGTNWNVVYLAQSTWVNGMGAPAAGAILGVGTFNVGDVASGDPVYTITHNLNISGDYGLLFTLESNNAASYFRNNKVGGTWYHHATDKPNKVYVSLQEISSEVQDLTISWMIYKR
jgi:hypothetical protein